MTQTHYWPLWRESSMTDQCHRCTMRGDFAGCKATPCNIHESWHVEQLNATISRLEAELAESRDKHMDDLLALNATAKDMREQKKTISRLLRYAYHEEECAVMTCCGDLPPCDCGYDELLAALEETK